MQVSMILSFVLVAFLALVSAAPEPDAPVYGAPAHGHGHGGGYGGGSGGQGWGWAPRRYLNLRIPIPQLPKIRLGINAGFKASIAHGNGWRK